MSTRVRTLGHFGRVVRKLRVDRDMNLKQMAQAVGVSSAFLSAVETKGGTVSKGLLAKIMICLGVAPGSPVHLEMENAICLDRGAVTVSLDQASPKAVSVALLFSRALPGLSDSQLSKVLSICNKRQKAAPQGAE